ncbi:MAG TPA: hypothetical protein DEF12_06500 [Rhodobacteraceae bacterium]|jgi:hypothetical protein|nr:hypothetical protein [Paracoccaceae bacterium]HBV54673.1 hypothetical protein [Paracoccaceae bacterium]
MRYRSNFRNGLLGALLSVLAVTSPATASIPPDADQIIRVALSASILPQPTPTVGRQVPFPPAPTVLSPLVEVKSR